MTSSRFAVPLRVAYTLALSLWIGGLVVLGAIVAPTVFGIVPAPTSADAMTVVFRKFDVVAITCAIVALVAEAGLARIARRPARVDVARGAATVVAAGLAIVEGFYLSPQIQSLHREGAVRGYGEPGLRLEAFHRWAERSSKIELALLTVALVLVVASASTSQDGRAPTSAA